MENPVAPQALSLVLGAALYPHHCTALDEKPTVCPAPHSMTQAESVWCHLDTGVTAKVHPASGASSHYIFPFLSPCYHDATFTHHSALTELPQLPIPREQAV